jgi:glycosyltransferase involved in cell wall biosynthesis
MARTLRYVQFRSLASRVFQHYDLLRLWWYQTRAIRRFDRVFVCSDRDRRRLGRDNVVVVPNGVAVPPELPAREPDARTILFCGVLSYAPNVDAIRFFVSAILPRVRHEVPDARLLVVGRTPTPEIRALHDGTTVVVEADVPSVAAYYRRAALAVAPLRMGGGTRIKILEAWALGVPVVSTTIGCEGLEGVNGIHLRVADEPDRFARACVELLRDPSVGAPLAVAGRQLVRERYRWEAVTERAVAAVKDVVDGRPQVPSAGTRLRGSHLYRRLY